MLWFVIACCLTRVYCANFENDKFTNSFDSQPMSAQAKGSLTKCLTNKEMITWYKGSPFNAFCVKEVLGYEVEQQEQVENYFRYHLNVIIQGGLGNEASIGKCRDSNVFIRNMKVSLKLAVPSSDLNRATWSFALTDVFISPEEAIFMQNWVQTNSKEMQEMTQQNLLHLGSPLSMKLLHSVAASYPSAPWLLEAKKGTKAPLQVHEPFSQRNNPLLRANAPLLKLKDLQLRRRDRMRSFLEGSLLSKLGLVKVSKRHIKERVL